MTPRKLLVALAMLALTAAACSSDADPSVTAAAEAADGTITVTATVVGLEIVADPPSDDHLHYFLDVEPTLDGTPIPADDPAIIHSRETSVTFEGVAAGEHTITIVVGGADHVPGDPAVSDSVTVTV